MSEPTSKDEYEQRFRANERITGVGAEACMHAPCPFCAEPEFMVWTIWPGAQGVEAVMSRGATCVACGRGAKALFRRTDSSTYFEVVQTVGPDPAAWLPPMRRVESP